MDNNIVRKKIICHGHVQGVGFRYNARYLANEYEITGWVKNEYDGTVLMELQGSEEYIGIMLRELSEDRYIRISYMDIDSIPVVMDEKKFRVKY